MVDPHHHGPPSHGGAVSSSTHWRLRSGVPWVRPPCCGTPTCGRGRHGGSGITTRMLLWCGGVVLRVDSGDMWWKLTMMMMLNLRHISHPPHAVFISLTPERMLYHHITPSQPHPPPKHTVLLQLPMCENLSPPPVPHPPITPTVQDHGHPMMTPRTQGIW